MSCQITIRVYWPRYRKFEPNKNAKRFKNSSKMAQGAGQRWTKKRGWEKLENEDHT